MTTLDRLREVSQQLVEVDTNRETLRQQRDALVVQARADGARWTDIEDLRLPGLARGNINKILNRARANA